jgi:hypothetical protein
MTMLQSQAIDIIEGVVEADEEKTIEAWQTIYDTGLYRHLQGHYGRTVERMLADGTLTP